jgi:hypothetical protein
VLILQGNNQHAQLVLVRMHKMSNSNGNKRGGQIVKVGQAHEIETALPIAVIMRTYFSSYHLWAARHFSVLASNTENEDGKLPRFNIKHRAYVTNAILSGVAFLEAAINELFQDIVDGHESYIAALDIDSKRQMSEYWLKKRHALLDKYQKALTCLRKQPFNGNHPPYLEAQLVIQLRNALVHYKPKSFGGGVEHDLAKELAGKFMDNRLMNGSGNPWFPDKCLGHGCAEWAVHSATVFADEFFRRIGVKPNYQRVEFKPLPNEV